jgi:glyoxylase-like metal-dependent hydrolase (beta-lactamase superfamily II)
VAIALVPPLDSALRFATGGVAMGQWQIGEVRITLVVELGPSPTSPRFLFHDPPRDLVQRHRWLKPHFANDEGRLLMSIQAFVVESQGRRILIDTCIGNDKKRAFAGWNQLHGPFLRDLTVAGFAPDSIDTVLCTHLHVDHVGWNTRLEGGRWVPTFPRARYLIARKEWEHWSSGAKMPALYGANATPSGGEAEPDDELGDSVRPIIDAGLADFVETDHRLTGEVWLQPTPGHTPGHVSVRIESQGQRAVITGDLMHHPIQCAEPDREVRSDSDPALGRTTRKHFLACCVRDRPLVFGTHFAAPTAGHVVPHGDVWRFEAWLPAAERHDPAP